MYLTIFLVPAKALPNGGVHLAALRSAWSASTIEASTVRAVINSLDVAKFDGECRWGRFPRNDSIQLCHHREAVRQLAVDLTHIRRRNSAAFLRGVVDLARTFDLVAVPQNRLKAIASPLTVGALLAAVRDSAGSQGDSRRRVSESL